MIAIANVLIIDIDNAVVADRNTVDIRSQVLKRRLPVANRLSKAGFRLEALDYRLRPAFSATEAGR